MGGYQVCQKWLKDRQERRLELDDIRTYCRIVTALGLTLDIQRQLDLLYPDVEKNVVAIPGHTSEVKSGSLSPLTKEDLQSGTVRARATDLSTGKTEELSTKPHSVCHFFEPFECGSYRVCLRLDWKDLDSQGNPTLDADFYDLGTDEIDKSMKSHEAHHTMAQGDEDRTYEWEFADESRNLRVTLTWSVRLSCAVGVNASLSMKLIHAGEDT